MKTTINIIYGISFATATLWALFIRALCALWGWPWQVSLVSFVVIFVCVLFALALVDIHGGLGGAR